MTHSGKPLGVVGTEKSHMRRGDFGAQVPEMGNICLLLTNVQYCYKFKAILGKILNFRPALATEIDSVFQNS